MPPEEPVTEEPVVMPPMAPEQIQDQFAALGRDANRLIMTDLGVWYGNEGGGGTEVGPDCASATRCTPATDEFSLIFTPENLGDTPRQTIFESRGERHGVPIVEYTGTSNDALQSGSLSPLGSVDYRTLGGWMDHNFFTVNLWEFERTGWQVWNAASSGVETGSNPVSGSATWTGAMVGRLSRGDHEPGEAVVGASRLTCDFAQNDIDVALTGIQLESGTTSYRDLTWENISTASGRFSGEGLRGSFYGPNHEEVGGVFENDSMLGAFGATRE